MNFYCGAMVQNITYDVQEIPPHVHDITLYVHEKISLVQKIKRVVRESLTIVPPQHT